MRLKWMISKVHEGYTGICNVQVVGLCFHPPSPTVQRYGCLRPKLEIGEGKTRTEVDQEPDVDDGPDDPCKDKNPL